MTPVVEALTLDGYPYSECSSTFDDVSGQLSHVGINLKILGPWFERKGTRTILQQCRCRYTHTVPPVAVEIQSRGFLSLVAAVREDSALAGHHTGSVAALDMGLWCVLAGLCRCLPGFSTRPVANVGPKDSPRGTVHWTLAWRWQFGWRSNRGKLTRSHMDRVLCSRDAFSPRPFGISWFGINISSCLTCRVI